MLEEFTNSKGTRVMVDVSGNPMDWKTVLVIHNHAKEQSKWSHAMEVMEAQEAKKFKTSQSPPKINSDQLQTQFNWKKQTN